MDGFLTGVVGAGGYLVISLLGIRYLYLGRCIVVVIGSRPSKKIVTDKASLYSLARSIVYPNSSKLRYSLNSTL